MPLVLRAKTAPWLLVPPLTVVPYRVPPARINPPCGWAPSLPPVKLYRLVNPEPSRFTANTTPSPLVPPYCATPYTVLPDKTNPAYGLAPSLLVDAGEAEKLYTGARVCAFPRPAHINPRPAMRAARKNRLRTNIYADTFVIFIIELRTDSPADHIDRLDTFPSASATFGTSFRTFFVILAIIFCLISVYLSESPAPGACAPPDHHGLWGDAGIAIGKMMPAPAVDVPSSVRPPTARGRSPWKSLRHPGGFLSCGSKVDSEAAVKPWTLSRDRTDNRSVGILPEPVTSAAGRNRLRKPMLIIR